MINNFTDLAANERTYLAWIRTAITIMAFGFLIEKFELFFRLINQRLGLKTPVHLSSTFEVVGIAMMIVSVLLIVGASIRYIIQRKKIMSEDLHQTFSGVTDLILATFLASICVLLIVYILIGIV